MKIKKIFLILIMMFCLIGCSNVNDLNYDDIINNLSLKAKSPNVYKKGYQYYLPSGILIDNSGTNYAILSDESCKYYLYVDLISYINKKDNTYEIKNGLVYSKIINYGNRTGYIEIKLQENNKYLIEIMYNYAKIEVMVDEHLVNRALVNSISILNSIQYNDVTIERILEDNELHYSEEIFELFEKDNINSDTLEFEDNVEDTSEEEVKDTDFIN